MLKTRQSERSRRRYRTRLEPIKPAPPVTMTEGMTLLFRANADVSTEVITREIFGLLPPETKGNGCSYIGKCAPRAEITKYPCANRQCMVHQQRDTLAAVVSRRSSWIVAVICGQYQQIGSRPISDEARQPPVESAKSIRETFRIVAMSVEHVEIDEISQIE